MNVSRTLPPLLLLVSASAALLMGCPEKKEAAVKAGGLSDDDHRRGQAAIDKYACASCHAIPGAQAGGQVVGPPLDHFASRPSIAGKVPNNATNLQKWLENPQSVDPHASMPSLGVTPGDARDIAAYLYTFK
jgi:cytochrome c